MAPKPRSKAAHQEQLDRDIETLADLRARKEVLDEEIKEVQERITNSPYWQTAGSKSYEHVSSSGFRYKASYQQTAKRTINEDKLKRLVGPSVWRKITTLVLDRKKAEALVAEGTIDPTDYAACIEESYSQPFVKVTTK